VAAAILLQSYLASRESAATPASNQDSSTVDSIDEAPEHSSRVADRGRRARHSRVSGH
jgi:hypothetical protein